MCSPLSVTLFTFNTESVPFGTSGKSVQGLYSKLISSKPDVLVISLQEADRRDRIIDNFQNKYKDYILLKREQLMGVGKEGYRGFKMAIFIKKNKTAPAGTTGISVLPSKTARGCGAHTKETLDTGKTGLGMTAVKTLFGKGYIRMSIRTNNGVISFINAHLPFFAPKTKQGFQKRKQCMQGIINDAELQDSSCIFFMGDLNFRVDMDPVEALTALNSGKLDSLRAKDQLNKKVLSEFQLNHNMKIQEHGINFYPTCKLKQGRDKSCTKNMAGCYTSLERSKKGKLYDKSGKLAVENVSIKNLLGCKDATKKCTAIKKMLNKDLCTLCGNDKLQDIIKQLTLLTAHSTLTNLDIYTLLKNLIPETGLSTQKPGDTEFHKQLSTFIFNNALRIPSWCDRILFWSKNKNIIPKEYGSADYDTMNQSDHIGVYLTASISCN